MKRKLISLITVFALCLSLCPTWALAVDTATVSKIETLKENRTTAAEFIIDEAEIFDVRKWSYTATKTTAIVIQSTGTLYLQGLEGGSVISAKGIGVKVESGGGLFLENVESGDGLFLENPVAVTGKTYGLDVASGAAVELSGGSFSGDTAAIKTEDGNFAALLADGYAYYNANGSPMLPKDVAAAKTVTIRQCAGHPGKTYAHDNGAPTHSWTCPYCGAKAGEEPCTFNFGADGNAACVCGDTITIAVDETSLGDLIYNSEQQTADISLTVTLGDGTTLNENTDYTVSNTKRADVGEITVTVTGVTYNGTFTKTYSVSQAQPAIAWAETAKAVDYNGSPVKPADLPNVTITAPDDLSSHIQYSYKKDGDTDFTDGLPTNAGTYEIKASLPESQNYQAAETNPCLRLTINKIPAVKTAPAAKTLTYSREPQELITAGALEPGAVAEGAKIEYKLGTDGTYSTGIPTGIGVSSYNVYYQIADTDNYTGVLETLVPNPNPTQTYKSARINHKTITPTVELSYYTTLYDSGFKEPTVTVKDGEAVVPNTEYEVTYTNHINVGTATVTVTNKTNGNYIINKVTVNFRITLLAQNALSIADKPNTVTYGDQFTLSTTGGSGNGTVTWEITAGGDVAEVDANSGQVTIKGVGTAAVRATKSGTDPQTNKENYEDAIAIWTFTAVKKPVTATVTADNKVYNGDPTATVRAVVEQGVLPGDVITVTGLSGTFSDENAGTNKTVTVTGVPSISGNHSQHYDVTLSSRSVKADITKAEADIADAPGQIAPALIYDGTAQALVTAGTANIAGISLEYALSENGPYFPGIPKAVNAGSYEVWYRVPETPNYTGTAADKVPVTIQRKPVSDPVVTLDPDNFVYDGAAKEPAVTVTYTNDSGEIVTIPAGEYTKSYSNNVKVGTAEAKPTVTVTARADGNYDFSATENFTISQEKAQVVTAPSPAGDPLTYNTREQALVTAGAAFGGTMVYSVGNRNGTYSPAIPAKSDAGDYTVWYKVKGDSNHADSDVGSVVVTIGPKVVKDPTIELKNADGTLIRYTYDGAEKTPKPVVKDGSTEIIDTEYDVTYVNNKDAGTATVTITDKAGGNYTVTGSTTFVIDKADIADPAPSAADLTYNGKPQELLNGSSFDGGTILYSMSKNGTYTDAIPTATNAGSYIVWYKVTGDKNHNDLAAKSVNHAVIKRKPLTTVTIELSPNAFAYDGQVHMPTVTVKVGNTVLPESEYTAVCSTAEPKDEGIYTITISDAADGNYDLTGITTTTADFAIGKAPQAELVIDHKTAVTNYGESFTLTATGGSGGGDVTWEATSPATVDAATGEVKITGVGDITITATKAAEGNYFEAKATWTFTAAPRPVTAVVAVKNKAYDGGVSAAIDTVTVPVLSGDTVTVEKTSLTATFADANVGTGKKVTLDSSEAAVGGEDADKYDISYPASVRADITQAANTLTEPGSKAPLTYSGRPQELVTAAAADFGDVVYSLDGTNFSTAIPTGTNAGDYTVYYKVVGNANYSDAAGTPISVTIAPKTITPTAEASPSSCVYDGSKKTPTITVKDGITVLDGDQYAVSWGSTDWTSAGTHTATITSTGKNYIFTDTSVTAEVEIRKAIQNALNITGKPATVHYGDIITLDTTGGSGNGSVKWTLTGGTSSSIGETTGVLEIKEMGAFTVTAEREAANFETAADTWTFTVQPKQVTAVVTAKDKAFNNDTDVELTVTVPGTALTVTNLTGTFDSKDVGTGKTVRINHTHAQVTGNEAGNYEITYPDTTTASIYKVDAKLAALPVTNSGLVYDGHEHALLTNGGATVNGIGVVEYSLSEKGEYSTEIPKATNAGAYTVWYRVADSVNYTGIAPASREVTIAKAEPTIDPAPTASDITFGQTLSQSTLIGGVGSVDGSFAWTDGSLKPPVGTSEQEVAFTPDDAVNYEKATAFIEITVNEAPSGEETPGDDNPGGTDTETGSIPFLTTTFTQTNSDGSTTTKTEDERTGTVTEITNKPDGSSVTKVEQTDGTTATVTTDASGKTEAEVTLSAQAVSEAQEKGEAVVLPIPEVKAARNADTAPAVTINTGSGDEVMVEIPAADVTPGTVAVLVKADGTQEVIKTSVPTENGVAVSLPDGATVKLVDNSKDFADVPAESQEAGAVAFTSARELFRGTSETTFDPDVPMTRAMMTTVLARLDGVDTTGGATWYEKGQEWAVAKGISNGSNPNGSITREQLAVMLWRYAGCPAADGEALSFTDADRASEYAMEALRWAAAKGILGGTGDGLLDPGGTATRAEAAQILKNFIENA